MSVSFYVNHLFFLLLQFIRYLSAGLSVVATDLHFSQLPLLKRDLDSPVTEL